MLAENDRLAQAEPLLEGVWKKWVNYLILL
jgi:hypothetical protein